MLELLESRTVKQDADSMNILYMFKGLIDRDVFHQSDECREIFRRCYCEHDCCGHWFASYVLDYHFSKNWKRTRPDGYTAIVVRYLKNV